MKMYVKAGQTRHPLSFFFVRREDRVAATTTKSLISHVNGGF